MNPARRIPRFPARLACLLSVGFALGSGLSACSLPAVRAPMQQTYRLLPADIRTAALPQPVVLQMLRTNAAPGFESSAMMYSRTADTLSPYRDSRWLAAPSQLIDDAIARTLSRQPWISAVQQRTVLVNAPWTLHCSLNRLEHDVSTNPGTVRLDLSCQLIDNPTERIAAHWAFDGAQPVAVNDAGHFAQAAQTLLDQALAGLVDRIRSAVARPQPVPAASTPAR
ncbi:hypothetical protein GALL_413730 [mine drainage metagenome]|uniref:ABC-type transport auxiliary lipoprotein component domain-containing protein n=1 Tax=mine drainage metagenome TaxID=410659 RepID=A0A1J5QHE0_9ZZZZ